VPGNFFVTLPAVELFQSTVCDDIQTQDTPPNRGILGFGVQRLRRNQHFAALQ